jgi:hypothetical protein
MNLSTFFPGGGAVLAAGGLLVSPCHAGLSEATDFDGPWSTAGIQYDAGQPPSTGVYWVERYDTALDGTDAVEGTLGGTDAVQSWVETQVTGPATLYFSYRVQDDPATSYDCVLEVMVGVQSTVLYRRQLGEVLSTTDTGWRETSVAVASGTQTVRWQLGSNRGRSRARVFLDQVWPSTDARPRITANPGQSLTLGTPFSMSVPVASASPVTLTADGLPPGLSLHSDTHEFQGTPTASGSYRAQITAANAAGRHITEISFVVQAGTTSLPEALDAPNLVFTQPDNATNWAGVTGQGHDGIDSARATVGTMQTFSPPLLLSTTVNGPGTLSFWYRCDERGVPADRTLLRLYLGPVSVHQPLAQFEETAWSQYTLTIPPGPQLVTWGAWRMTVFQDITPILYTYLDEVVFTPTTIPPQPTFTAWTTAWNVAGQPASTDTDGDGLDLVMEYATGGSPYVPNPELLPSASIVDGHFTLRFTKAPSPTDLLYFAQGTRTLLANSWTTSLVEVIDEDNTTLVARSKKPVSQEPVMNLRVLVLVTP